MHQITIYDDLLDGGEVTLNLDFALDEDIFEFTVTDESGADVSAWFSYDRMMAYCENLMEENKADHLLSKEDY